MTSTIDPTVPVAGTPTTASVRGNFQIAHDEITALQNAVPAASTTPPAMDGTAAPGTATTFGRGDHVHPTDTSRYAASNPAGYQTAAQVAPALNNVGRNQIHNSLFNVAQRGTGPFTTAGGYTLDRWLLYFTLDTPSVTKQSFAPGSMALDEAAENYLSNTFTGNAAAGASTIVYQLIEDARRPSNKTVTVSFAAATASGTLKLGVSLDQLFGTGGSPSAAVYGNGQSVTINTTWTRYSLTFAVGSVFGKTLGSNNDNSTALNFWYSSGTGTASRSGNVGVQSGTIALWGVQLEIGSAATPLEKSDPQQDFAKCQRFFWTGQVLAQGVSSAAYAATIPVTMPVQPRAAPTITVTTNADSGLTSPTQTYMSGGIIAFSGATPSATIGWTINRVFTASMDL